MNDRRNYLVIVTVAIVFIFALAMSSGAPFDRPYP